MFLVDSNVLIDIANDDQTWAPWSAAALSEAMRNGTVMINPIIYAEVSLAFDTIETLDEALDSLGVTRRALPFEAGFLAARAYLKYRRAGGSRSAPMPDFYIGAHAVLENLALLTRDPRRFRSYFPTAQVVSPS